jgi:hypothetical protein
MREHFFAPWSTRLKLMTGGLAAILIVAAAVTAGPGSLVILAILLAAAAFSIRGYSVKDGRLLIHRLGWSDKFELSELLSAKVSPGATMGSLRTMGIGGLFGFVGHFHNEILGSYKAFATNEFNTVVLVFGNQTIVVTPDDPEEFVEAVTAAKAALLMPTPEAEAIEE